MTHLPLEELNRALDGLMDEFASEPLTLAVSRNTYYTIQGIIGQHIHAEQERTNRKCQWGRWRRRQERKQNRRRN